MPDIYTAAWYESLKDVLNRSEQVTAMAPSGHFRVLAEIRGDGVSPYLGDGQIKRFTLEFEEGKCTGYREFTDAPTRRDFDFTVDLPANLFEGIVANQVDPVEAGLKGDIRIIGDMRLLIQHAELVNLLHDIYVRDIKTDWPRGKPPYA
ncbi:MAG: SCP2 sterol-binding domain-containing protein [Dehalococcoidia bacterium]|nr:MAG: SCP2 sterol-binding domain-containing protein [Dehalococcoidia bacterium]